MSEKKLLKMCPFCGGEALLNVVPPHKHKIAIFPDYEGGAFIECTKCTCAMSGDTEEEAIKLWNTRVPMQKIVERLNNNFRKVQNDEDLEWNRAIYKTIDIVKEGGLND